MIPKIERWWAWQNNDFEYAGWNWDKPRPSTDPRALRRLRRLARKQARRQRRRDARRR